MRRRSEFWLIGVIILITLAIVIIPLTVFTSLEKIDEFFSENLNEEIGRCVNLENCNLSDFMIFLRNVCAERSYNLSVIYSYCNLTNLEIGNFYGREVNITLKSELTEENISLANGEVAFYNLSDFGKEINLSYLGKETQINCEKKTIFRDICLSFLGSLKCFLTTT